GVVAPHFRADSFLLQKLHRWQEEILEQPEIAPVELVDRAQSADRVVADLARSFRTFVQVFCGMCALSSFLYGRPPGFVRL
ncbi:MAG: hypothetical protein ABIR28_10120, partial [Vicinamibacteria bacterium]